MNLDQVSAEELLAEIYIKCEMEYLQEGILVMRIISSVILTQISVSRILVDGLVLCYIHDKIFSV